MDLKNSASVALGLMDLTSLNDNDTEQDIIALCQKTKYDFGHVAAVCVYSQFVKCAKSTLKSIGAADVKVATVTNFPNGDQALNDVLKETEQALLDGADEIDVVMPYQEFLNGKLDNCIAIIKESKALCVNYSAKLKVIIETGKLQEPKLVNDASLLAIKCGADFIKTSTGKVEVNATLEFADIMLTAILQSGVDVGFKAAGGIRTAADANEYLMQAKSIMGDDWLSSDHFRFGASGLLTSLLQILDDTKMTTPDSELNSGY
jgi:deoxyribose-phosphate aldolase